MQAKDSKRWLLGVFVVWMLIGGGMFVSAAWEPWSHNWSRMRQLLVALGLGMPLVLWSVFLFLLSRKLNAETARRRTYEVSSFLLSFFAVGLDLTGTMLLFFLLVVNEQGKFVPTILATVFVFWKMLQALFGMVLLHLTGTTQGAEAQEGTPQREEW